MNAILRPLRSLLACLFASLAATSPALVRAETRTWTDSTGKFTIEAEFVDIVEGQVRLKKADGQVISLPLSKLSKDDQAYLRELMRQRRTEGGDANNPFQGGGGQPRGDSGGFGPAGTGGFSGFPRGGGGRFRRGFGGFEEEHQYKEGDKVEVYEDGAWQAGVVAGFDTRWNRIYVKLDSDGSMVEATTFGQELRPFDPNRGPVVGGAGQTLSRVDLTSIRRVIPLGGSSGEFTPDPASADPLGWNPRPVGLNPRSGFFEKVAGLSFAAGAGQAVVAYSGGAGIHDDSSRLEVCDLKAGRVLGVVSGPRNLKLFALSPTGQRLATISEVGTFEQGPLQIWEIAGKELKHVASWHVTAGERPNPVEWIGWVDEQHVMTIDYQGVTMWNVDGPDGEYCVAGDRMQAPAFSPGRKQFAIGSDKGFSIHDVASGELLTRIAMDRFDFQRQVAFSPSGKLLAATGSSLVEIYDGATGRKLTEAYSAAAQSRDAALCWLDEEHVLVGGTDLIHLPSQVKVWTYQHQAEAVVPLAGRVWYVFGDRMNEQPALLPFNLPHDAVKPVADSELVLRPGDRVSIAMELVFDMQQGGGGEQQTPQDQLRDALTASGFIVVDQSNKRLVGRTTPGETREIEYRMFGAPPGQTQKTSYTERVFELELSVDGEIVWSRRRVIGAPFHLQLQEGESVDQAVQRVMFSDTGFFRSTVPPRVLPTAAEKARTSTLSTAGIE